MQGTKVYFSFLCNGLLLHWMVIAGNKQLPRSGSNRRVAVIRPNSPKSPAASASAFESADGSDEDDATQHGGKLDNGYINTNGNLVSSHLSLVMVFSCYYFYSSTPLSFIFLCQSRSWHEFVCQGSHDGSQLFENNRDCAHVISWSMAKIFQGQFSMKCSFVGSCIVCRI